MQEPHNKYSQKPDPHIRSGFVLLFSFFFFYLEVTLLSPPHTPVVQ